MQRNTPRVNGNTKQPQDGGTLYPASNLTYLAPPGQFLISICLVDINAFARFGGIPSMTQDIMNVSSSKWLYCGQLRVLSHFAFGERRGTIWLSVIIL